MAFGIVLVVALGRLRDFVFDVLQMVVEMSLEQDNVAESKFDKRGLGLLNCMKQFERAVVVNCIQ